MIFMSWIAAIVGGASCAFGIHAVIAKRPRVDWAVWIVLGFCLLVLSLLLGALGD